MRKIDRFLTILVHYKQILRGYPIHIAMAAPRHLALLPEQLAELELPDHIGRSATAIKRTHHRASLFDVIVKLIVPPLSWGKLINY